MFAAGGPIDKLPGGLEGFKTSMMLGAAAPSMSPSPAPMPLAAMSMARNATNATAGNATDKCSGGGLSATEFEVVIRDGFGSPLYGDRPSDLPSFSLGMNLIGVFSATGTAMANLIFPRLSDKYGRKRTFGARLWRRALGHVCLWVGWEVGGGAF